MAFLFEQCELNSASIAIAILVMYTVVYFPNYFTLHILYGFYLHVPAITANMTLFTVPVKPNV